MEDSFMAETAQALVPVYNFDLFSYNYIAEYGKERKDRWHCRFPVYDKKRHMVHLESIRQITYSRAAFVGMGHNDDLVTAIDEFLGKILAAYIGKLRSNQFTYC